MQRIEPQKTFLVAVKVVVMHQVVMGGLQEATCTAGRIADALNVVCRNSWILRNLADPEYGMLRACTVFHSPRFLQATRLLSLIALALWVLILFATGEHAKLEKIEPGATIHASLSIR